MAALGQVVTMVPYACDAAIGVTHSLPGDPLGGGYRRIRWACDAAIMLGPSTNVGFHSRGGSSGEATLGTVSRRESLSSSSMCHSCVIHWCLVMRDSWGGPIVLVLGSYQWYHPLGFKKKKRE